MQVKIYTDGAARGNPDGPGGYGAVLQYIDTKGQLHERELSRGYKKTTNNRMELMGVIAGLEALRTMPLGREEMAVVCRPDHCSGNRITLEELAGERLLLREKGSGTRDSIDTVFGAAGLTVSAFLDSSSTYALLSCAREGLGVTILPRCTWRAMSSISGLPW